MAESFDSGSDRRVNNNVMRHEYRQLSEEEKEQMRRIKDIGLEFVEYVQRLGQSREISLAITNVQQAVFWGVSHITR